MPLATKKPFDVLIVGSGASGGLLARDLSVAGATSVLDPFCRAHEVKNLFVVDGSCFVSAGICESDHHHHGYRCARR
jgi:choline dehydrogenase-like flavoprotein